MVCEVHNPLQVRILATSDVPAVGQGWGEKAHDCLSQLLRLKRVKLTAKDKTEFLDFWDEVFKRGSRRRKQN